MKNVPGKGHMLNENQFGDQEHDTGYTYQLVF
jgi:hypothetical protein